MEEREAAETGERTNEFALGFRKERRTWAGGVRNQINPALTRRGLTGSAECI